MSKNIVVNLRNQSWSRIYSAIEEFRSARKSDRVYATFLIDNNLVPQVCRLVRDYDLEDVCEIRSEVGS